MNSAELREALQCTERQLRKWIAAGLPYTKAKGRRHFDPTEVAQWLTDHGYAQQPPAETIVHTRQEAAARLGVSLRTLAHWLTFDDFPGQAGAPGRRDGHFPIEQIEQWRAERIGSGPSSAREQLDQVRLAHAQLDLRERLGQLIDADDVRRILARQIAIARAILDALPDKLAGRLPRKLSRAERTRIREAIVRDLDDAYDALAEQLAQLDHDPDNPDDE